MSRSRPPLAPRTLSLDEASHRRAFTRRALVRSLGGAVLALPFFERVLAPELARAEAGLAKRLIVLYHPDGVPGPSQNGDASKWHPTGSEQAFELPTCLEPLAPYKAECVFFRGLSMGPTDSGSHPGGAKKLLTGVDGGQGRSIDQELAWSVGAGAPWKHLYLGAAATVGGASGDKHISYVAPGQSIAPNDDPASAFSLLFGGAPSGGGGGGRRGGGAPDPREVSVIDGVLADMDALRLKLGATEKAKLDLHLEALREVEKRIKEPAGQGGGSASAGCDAPTIDTTGFSSGELHVPEKFPAILKAQLDLAVLATACGLTQVVTVQASHHTSELIMSRFEGTEMYEPGYDMRSHQASHYGASHDFGKKEFSSFVKQSRWWSSQLAYLLGELAARPEGDGTMLDHSLVLYVTEVCDGNTHLHDDLPLVLAGRAGGKLPTGRLVQTNGARHASVLAAVAAAMGSGLGSFGDTGSGPLPGLLA
jgi:hypothetical protein